MTTHTDRCPECNDTGYRDIKSPDDTSGYTYCTCEIGRFYRRQDKERYERERIEEAATPLPW